MVPEITIQTFVAEVGQAMCVAITAPTELPAAMGVVDGMYQHLVSQGHQEEVNTKINEEILVHLREHPDLFARFNFASSLLSKPQSPFYLAIIEVCRSQLPRLTQDDLLKVIEGCRRNKMYQEMTEAINILESQLGSTDTFIIRSKVSYERHMASYQQALDAESDPPLYKELLIQSLLSAFASAEYAKAGDDIAGSLFALMNIGGLLMWRLGEWRAAILHSTGVCGQAKELVRTTDDEMIRTRAHRVVMNTYMHRINILAQFGGGVGREDVEKWLDLLRQNPIFVSAKDQGWAVAAVLQAQIYTHGN